MKAPLCQMWGDCRQQATGYILSVTIPASRYPGETQRTYTCSDHGNWYVGRHPEQVVIPLRPA